MPIIIQEPIQAVGQATFKSIDYKVMGIAYRIHQELGRLFDEKVYAAALAEQLNDAGIDACREVQIKLTHKGFEKKYRIDLLVNSSIPYELKTVDRFHPSHDAQVLQYLFLTNVRHGKLLNFGSRSVEGRFIDSKIEAARRTAFSINIPENDSDHHIEQIAATLRSLLEDWGAYLTVALYREALTSLLETAETTLCPANYRGRKIGNIELTILDEEAILYVSSLKSNRAEMRSHIIRTLRLTGFEHSYWVNFNRNRMTIERVTLD
jgi:GxxExxY protein